MYTKTLLSYVFRYICHDTVYKGSCLIVIWCALRVWPFLLCCECVYNVIVMTTNCQAMHLLIVHLQHRAAQRICFYTKCSWIQMSFVCKHTLKRVWLSQLYYCWLCCCYSAVQKMVTKWTVLMCNIVRVGKRPQRLWQNFRWTDNSNLFWNLYIMCFKAWIYKAKCFVVAKQYIVGRQWLHCICVKGMLREMPRVLCMCKNYISPATRVEFCTTDLIGFHNCGPVSQKTETFMSKCSCKIM